MKRVSVDDFAVAGRLKAELARDSHGALLQSIPLSCDPAILQLLCQEHSHREQALHDADRSEHQRIAFEMRT